MRVVNLNSPVTKTKIVLQEKRGFLVIVFLPWIYFATGIYKSQIDIIFIFSLRGKSSFGIVQLDISV